MTVRSVSGVLRLNGVLAGYRVPRTFIGMFACLAVTVLELSSCSADGLVAPVDDGVATDPSWARAVGTVQDLGVADSTDASMSLAWTQVDDGAGKPASYRLKYARPPIDWATATVGCTVAGTRVGAPASCWVPGLASRTTYEFQLTAYRASNGKWAGATYSNVASGATGAPSAGAVSDLAVLSVTDSSLTVRWTEVDDGLGSPAWYRVKYAPPPIDYSTATLGCAQSISGVTVGAQLSCTIEGLRASTVYDVQLMAYREEDGEWVGERLSNVAEEATATQAARRGIWIDHADLMSRPMSGTDWDELLDDANRDPGPANISDQDSNHDVYTLAAALVCVRAGQSCAKARQGVMNAIGTESGGRWLAVGRNLGAYVIAADLLNLRADGVATSDGTRVEQWIQGWLTKTLSDNNDASLMRGFEPFKSGANAAAQEGFAYAAVAAYLSDGWALQRAWDAFRTFACDPSAPDRENIYLDPIVLDGWAHDTLKPCAINPAGTTKLVPLGVSGGGVIRRLDGSLGGDMRRGGVYQWEPGYTSYPWVGLEGLVPAAVVLSRAGYPAFDVADRAVLRTHEYLWYVRANTGDVAWFDGVRAREIVHLVNVVYGTSYPISQTVAGGRTVGYTRWTHSSW